MIDFNDIDDIVVGGVVDLFLNQSNRKYYVFSNTFLYYDYSIRVSKNNWNNFVSEIGGNVYSPYGKRIKDTKWSDYFRFILEGGDLVLLLTYKTDVNEFVLINISKNNILPTMVREILYY
jgi:hypothetical protein